MGFHLLLIVMIVIQIPTYICADEDKYTTCSQSFQCGNIRDINYPFWDESQPKYCGHPSFQLTNCQSNDYPTITINSTQYRVLDIHNQTQTLKVVRDDYRSDLCPPSLRNATLDGTHFSYPKDTADLMLYYNCQINSNTAQPNQPNQFFCLPYKLGFYAVKGVPLNDGVVCDTVVSVRVQVSPTNTGSFNGTQVVLAGFGLQWNANNDDCKKCVEGGGRCGSDPDSGSFDCYPNPNPERNSSNSNIFKIVFPIGAVAAFVCLGFAIFSCRRRRKRIAVMSSQSESKDNRSSSQSKGLTFTTTPSSNFSQSIPSYPSSNMDFGKSSSKYLGVQVFNYMELEEATNNFDPSRELGEGGFGTVYYGNLRDGRVVAVKRLFENNYKRVEQFKNELDILTRLRHDNLVTLFGCTSRRSRELLLVYEYIPNGTVADHLHGSRSNPGFLSWPTRLKIAIETADALTYLHESDVIHRDVKTNNILLDNDFRVKVADFGLSRLFPTDVTHVSTAPQGTPGYVDPEYHQCYQLTEKSDVYSFGVVLIELISSKQAVDTSRERLDINLANMAINRIQNRAMHELVDPSLGFGTNSSVRRMTTLVAELAFRCLQIERDMRPSMAEVLETLRRIKTEELDTQQAEAVEIVIEDDVALLKGKSTPASPRSPAVEKQVRNASAPYSSG